MDTEKKIILAFTAEELETLYFALNNYAVENMHTSKTWGNPEARREDVWHRAALTAGRLQARVFEAAEELKFRK